MGTAEIIYVYEVKIVPYVNQLTDRFSDASVGCLENLAVVCLIQGASTVHNYIRLNVLLE